MSLFPNWQDFAVHQRQAQTGCIPTGYEMLLKAAGVTYVDYSSFQEDFDLDIGKTLGIDKFVNNFDSVSQVIQDSYSDIQFTREIFAKGEGKNKLAKIEALLRNSQFILISLAMSPFGDTGWHIMLVVDADKELLQLLYIVDAAGVSDVRPIKKVEFVQIHEDFDGGNDIAYLESW